MLPVVQQLLIFDNCKTNLDMLVNMNSAAAASANKTLQHNIFLKSEWNRLSHITVENLTISSEAEAQFI